MMTTTTQRKTSSSPHQPRIIAIDCGNSRVKLSDGHVVMSVDAASVTGSAVKTFLKNRQDHVVAWSSVSPSTWNVVRTMVAAHRLIDAGGHVCTHSLVRKVKADGAGTDRVLGCAGALFRLKDQNAGHAGACITVDCGTATTVNVVNDRREFIGGMIFPGQRLMARVLHKETARLPLVDVAEALRRTEMMTGSDTLSAIRSGVAHATVGGIVSAVQSARDRLRLNEVPVFITGGNAPLLLPILKHRLDGVHVPDLVLDAIRRIAENVVADDEGKGESSQGKKSTDTKNPDTKRSR
ncbi:MAG: type III pantothenate kinase [Candidatus Kapaibacterium sp.]